MKTHIRHELLRLTEALIEDYASRDDLARLEEIILGDPECMTFFLTHLELHGNLYWDAAGLGHETELPPVQASASLEETQELEVQRSRRDRSQRQQHTRVAALAAAALLLVSLAGLWISLGYKSTADTTLATASSRVPAVNKEVSSTEAIVDVSLPPRPEESPVVAPIQTTTEIIASHDPPDLSNDRGVVQFINSEIAEGWDDHELTAAARASDEDFIRRVYLDLAGRIPTAAEVQSFLTRESPLKRTQLVDRLLNSPEFASNFATVWTNLLVGRSRDRAIDREELVSYLEDQFKENRPWTETVQELLTATGRAEESGPANFLLAHLNNEAVPATAITARIFLCEQLQCTQCHTHPTIAEWGQNRFWEMNAFFQETAVQEAVAMDEKSGKKVRHLELVDRKINKPKPTYYESLQGVMQVAYPRFAGVDVKPEESVTLREQFAALFASEQNPQLAVAFVNRTWQQMFGYGFTTDVDDMGPHTQVSHPELLSVLGQAFEDSGYDIRRLVRWICLSEAYQLSSQPTVAESFDAPESGGVALFSRMYLKPLTAEQLFNSLMIAKGVNAKDLSTGKLFDQREAWLQQFFVAMDNEENSEMSTFDGSLSQTLMMINGDLVQQATDWEQGKVLRKIVGDPQKSDVDRIKELCLTALSRYPTDQELESIRKVIRSQVRLRTSQNVPPKVAVGESLRDLYWAYLNSSEFAVNR